MKRWLGWLFCGGVCLTAAVAGTLVQFRTVYGDVEIELLDQEKPVTSANFLQYIKDGAYDGSFFHRQVPGFVIQGGGFRVLEAGTTNATLSVVTNRPPITNEFNIGPMVSNTRGTVAMAKSSDPNSATSQFFFNLDDNSGELDKPSNSGGFTVFGRVVGGTNTLALFDSFEYERAEGTPLTNLVVDLGSSPFNEVPVTLLYLNTNNQFEVRFQDFVYVDITTLKVAVRPLETGQKEISWNGIAHATNVVEFTTAFPPQWQVLTNVVTPAEARPVVLDNSGDPRRFYRVRAQFPPSGL